MVWGLVDPSNFGDYYLNGEYIGWREKLENIFENEMNKERQETFDNDDNEYILSIVDKFTTNAGEIENREIPTEYRLIEGCKSPASMIKLGKGLVAVDSDLKNIIAEIEPNIHKFAPIRLRDQKGGDFRNSYYAMIIKVFLDSFVPERSDEYREEASAASYRAINNTSKTYSKIFISKEVSSQHHIWRDKKLIYPSIFISDELQSKIMNKNLRIFKHYKMNDS